MSFAPWCDLEQEGCEGLTSRSERILFKSKSGEAPALTWLGSDVTEHCGTERESASNQGTEETSPLSWWPCQVSKKTTKKKKKVWSERGLWTQANTNHRSPDLVHLCVHSSTYQNCCVSSHPRGFPSVTVSLLIPFFRAECKEMATFTFLLCHGFFFSLLCSTAAGRVEVAWILLLSGSR